MKKLLFIILTSILLFSCNNDPKIKLVEEWKEYYGVGMETDFDGVAYIKFGNKIEARKALLKAKEFGNPDAENLIQKYC